MNHNNSSPLSVSEAFELYRSDFIVFKNQSPKTEENHMICGRSFASFVNNKDITSVSFSDVRDWKNSLTRTRSQATVRNYIIKLRVVLAFLKLRGYEVLDSESIPVPQRPDSVVTYLTSQEVSALINATHSLKNKAIISLLYGSGIRMGELLSLERAHIVDGSFTVVGKGGKARLCFIDGRTQAYIDLYLATRKDKLPTLFVSQYLTKLSATNVQLMVSNAAKKAGITRRVTPHTLRHSFATNFTRNNGNMRHLQVLMGHSSLETTAHYAHVVDEDLRRAYASSHTT